MGNEGRERVYGRNPVWEVLQARRRRVYRLDIAEGVQERQAIRRLVNLAEEMRVPVRRVPRATLDRESDAHQGVAASVASYPYVDVQDILEQARTRQEPAFILLLDMLQNPQNLGTLLRTAEAVGVHGVIVPPRGAAGITSAVVASSAGASEHLLVAGANLAQAISHLQEAGVWVIGMDDDPQAERIDQADLHGPVGVVVGNEGEGMRRLVRQSCDTLLRVPMRGRVDSLNAGVAGSVALYTIWAARGFPGERRPPVAGRIDGPGET